MDRFALKDSDAGREVAGLWRSRQQPTRGEGRMNIRVTAWSGVAALALLAGVAHAAAAADKTLDRPALIKLADDYLSALVAHDAKKVPLASDVKTIENAKRIPPGEGLWKTTTAGPTEFKIVVPDTVSQQVGGIVMMQA